MFLLLRCAGQRPDKPVSHQPKGAIMGKSTVRVRLKSSNRVTLDWEPRWEPEIRNWAAKVIRDNKWRYDPLLEHADLLQDAYVTFEEVKAAYPRVTEPKHFMSLYKTSLIRRLTDEATKNIKKKEFEPEVNFDVNIFADSFIKELDNEGYLTILLHEAPADIRAALELFMNEETIEKLREPYHKPYAKLSPRETLNDRICSMIDTSYLTGSGRQRIRAKYDIVSRIRSWLVDEPLGRKEVLCR